jgi:hypothetical protein
VICHLRVSTYSIVFILIIYLIKKNILQDVPKRDRIAKELADKNSRYYRERKQKAIIQVQFTYIL